MPDPRTPSDGCIVWPETRVYDKALFPMPKNYVDDIQHVLIPHGVCRDRIERLAEMITDEYGDSELHLLCVLKGSRGFFAELVEHIARFHRYRGRRSIPFVEHYIRLKSYSGTQSTGQLQVMSDDLEVLRGKDVLIVEDIIDTGHTLLKFGAHLQQFGPKTVKTATLVEKRTEKNTQNVRGDFVGFSVPDVFIVGYCLDYNEMYRDLQHICVMAPSGIARYAEK